MRINRQEWLKTMGWLGAALLLAGLIRWQIEDTLRRITQVLLGVGGVLLLVAVVGNYRELAAYFRRRSTRLGANTLVLAVAVLAILAVLNLLGYRYHKRFDLTEQKLYTLSDQTQQILRNLQPEVRILEFSKDANPQLERLLPEYRLLSRQLRYERIDPQEQPELARQYEIRRAGEVIVVAGERTERLEEFTEQGLTNAILRVTREAVRTICFTEGHGEKSLERSDASGYRLVEQTLRAERYQVRAFNLAVEKAVPAECTVVVVAGPQTAFFPQEADLLEQYVNGGGKLLFLIDPFVSHGLDKLLAAWNIQVGDDLIIERNVFSQLAGTGPVVPLVGEYGVHRITEKVAAQTMFPEARSVRLGTNSRSEIQAVEILKTSPQSWAEKDISRRGGTVEFNEGKDLKGPVSIGVAAEKKTGEGKAARVVVIGDSDFASNADIRQAANADLFFNAVAWLAESEEMITVRPKNPKNRRVNLTAAQQTMLFWFTVVLLPAASLIAGAYVWWKRR